MLQKIIVLLLSYVSLALSLPRDTNPFYHDYISANVSIPFAYNESLATTYRATKNILHDLGICAKNITPASYHMTLVGFNIAVSQHLTNIEKQLLQQEITRSLQQATTSVLTEKLRVVDTISMPFQYFELFKKKMVAVFAKTTEFEEINTEIAHYFIQDPVIQTLRSTGAIVLIKPQQKNIKPHVSVANITDHVYMNMQISAPLDVGVNSFVIDAASNTVSVRWKAPSVTHGVIPNIA